MADNRPYWTQQKRRTMTEKRRWEMENHSGSCFGCDFTPGKKCTHRKYEEEKNLTLEQKIKATEELTGYKYLKLTSTPLISYFAIVEDDYRTEYIKKFYIDLDEENMDIGFTKKDDVLYPVWNKQIPIKWLKTLAEIWGNNA